MIKKMYLQYSVVTFVGSASGEFGLAVILMRSIVPMNTKNRTATTRRTSDIQKAHSRLHTRTASLIETSIIHSESKDHSIA